MAHMKIKYLNLFLPFFGALTGSLVTIYITLKSSELEIYMQEAPEKRTLYNQLSDQITVMKNSGIGIIMSYALSEKLEDFEKSINQFSKDCEKAKSEIENIYFKLSAFNKKPFDPEPLSAFENNCTPHILEHKNPLDLLEKYSRKNEESSRDFIKNVQNSLFKN